MFFIPIQITRLRLWNKKHIIRYDAPGSVLGLEAGSLDYLGVEEEEVTDLVHLFKMLTITNILTAFDYLGEEEVASQL